MRSTPEASSPSPVRWHLQRTSSIAVGLLLCLVIIVLDAHTPAKAQQSQVEILITSDKIIDGSDGWVQMDDGTKHWVSGDCRSDLLGANATLKVVPWPTIASLPDSAARQSCEQLLVSLFASPPTVPTDNNTTSSPVKILITAAQRNDGSPGWVKMPGGRKHWVNGNCRTKLVNAGAILKEVPMARIKKLRNVAARKSCSKLLDRLFSTPPTEPTDGTPAAPPANVNQNLALIAGNSTRNTLFDDNQFRDVPARDISVSDLTSNTDIYRERLLDTSNSGYFRVKCEVSHFAYDDPIVFPNQPGRAHLHMFFGNTQANAYSTFNSLLNSGTGTCNGEDLNRTAYWVPAMLDNQGNALIPDQIMVYYKNDNFRLDGANELVSPFPNNLRMIAGNGAAVSPQNGFTGDWQAQPAISFSCGPAYNSNGRRQALIPDCYGNSNHLEMQIAFPQCVNEAAGTYRPDQSHMSYSENGYYGARCPDSHPTDVSSIMYRIFFSVRAYGGSLTDLHLSSDVKMNRVLPGGTTAHADWFGAWHPEAMQMWIENCNNTRADCETGLLDRNPAISLVLRKQGFYPSGYLAPAAELVKLCPGKVHDPADPLKVGMCRMN